MRRDRCRSARLECGPGFALPFAVVVLVTFSLAVALLIDGAVAAFRTAGADLEIARVAAAAESALAHGIATRVDSAALQSRPGTVLVQASQATPDSVTTTVQVLTPPMVRIVVSVRGRTHGFRVLAGRLAFARMVTDSVSPGTLRIVPVSSAWWVPIP